MTFKQSSIPHLGYVRLYIANYVTGKYPQRQSFQLCLHAHQTVSRVNFLTVIMLQFQAFQVFAHTFFLHVVDLSLHQLVLKLYFFIWLGDLYYFLLSGRIQS